MSNKVKTILYYPSNAWVLFQSMTEEVSHISIKAPKRTEEHRLILYISLVTAWAVCSFIKNYVNIDVLKPYASITTLFTTHRLH